MSNTTLVLLEKKRRFNFPTLCFIFLKSRNNFLKQRFNFLKSRNNLLKSRIRKSNLDVVILLSNDRT